jgi:hypothetical protein
MAIKDMIEMAVVTLRPHQRHPAREQIEDHVPALQQAVQHFKALAYQVRKSMLSGGETFVRAQDVINALATPYFLPEFTWGVDSYALDHTRTIITQFFDEGHYSLVYVLQVKLLQVGVPPTSDEVTRLLQCKQHFMHQLDDVIASGNLPFALPPAWSGCQMFAPRDLVRLPAVAMHILNEGRPDILGRHSFHILSDAGASITWERSGNCVRFLAKDLGATTWPIEALDSHDLLGRTALHIAVRQGSISSVKALARSGADLHRTCLYGLSLLHIAACHGHANIVHHLIDKMHYHECVAECYTPTDTCQEIKTRYFPNIDPLDGLRRSPLWYAARGSHFEVMSTLVKRVSIRVTSEQRTVIRADPELPDSYGQTAASIAARDGRVNDLRYLLGLRGKSWSPLLEPLMINEHLLLAYAVQSRNRECVKLVLAQRQWRFGGPVFTRAMDYANRNFDEDLRSQLLHLYKSDEAIRTKQPLTGLTYHRPVEIPGVDWSTDLSTFKTQLPMSPQALDLGKFSVHQIFEAREPSDFQTIDALAMQETSMDNSTGQKSQWGVNTELCSVAQVVAGKL